MRKFLGASALAISVICSGPAAAQEEIVRGDPPAPVPALTRSGERAIEEIRTQSGWYVGGEFGAMIVEDSDVDIGAVQDALRLNFDYGYDGGIFVGYDLGAFRIEAEAAYKKADLDSYNTSIRLPLEGVAFPTSRANAGGNVSALSFMINGMLDFGENEKPGDISGFVGAGIGMARLKANNLRNFANATPFLDDSDSKLAWQVFAGVRHTITDNIDVTVKYRFFNVDDARMVAFNGNQSEMRFRSHSLLGGLTYRFGSVKKVEVCKDNGEPITATNTCMTTYCPEGTTLNAAGQCEGPPTADRKRCLPNGPWVSLETPLDCTMGPFNVYFGWDKRRIGEPGDPGEDPNEDPAVVRSQPTVLQTQLQRLQEAYDAYVKSGAVRVNIVGHADRSGDEAYNQVLSCDRAHAVRQYFLDRNVPQYVIQIQGRGESRAEGANDRELQDRRVEITINADTDLAGCPPPSPKMNR
jgi:opacity protein-like surface antigen